MSFEQGMVVGATWAGLSVSEPADLVEFSTPNHLCAEYTQPYLSIDSGLVSVHSTAQKQH